MELPLCDLSLAVVHRAQISLRQLSHQLATTPDAGRRQALQQYVAHTRTLLLRLLVLVRWTRERNSSFVKPCADDALRLNTYHFEIQRSVQDLSFLHRDGLWQACVPPYDMRAALDVVGHGSYTQLPRAIAPPPKPPQQLTQTTASSDPSAVEALAWLRGALRLRRTTWKLPALMEVSDASGSIVCTVPGEYELALSAHPPSDAPLKVLRLVLLGSGVAVGRTSAKARQRAQQALDAQPDQPLFAVHTDLHALCCERALDALHVQAGTLLRTSAWAASLRVERMSQPTEGKAARTGAAGVRLSYLWQPGGAAAGAIGGGAGADAAAAKRASIVITPAEETGLRLRHEPALTRMKKADSAPEEESQWVSAAALDAEAMLLSALRERSALTLREVARVLDEMRGPSLPAGPSGGVVANGLLPLLRVTEQASLAVSHRDGQYVCLAGKAARRLLGAVAPSGSAGPAAGVSAGVMAGVAAATALRLSPPLAALERAALAVGVPAGAVPPLAPLLSATDGAVLWAPVSSVSADASGVTDARWLPLTAAPGWGVEVRVSIASTAEDAPTTSPSPRLTLEYNLLWLQPPATGALGATARAVFALTSEVDAAEAAEMAAPDTADLDGSARLARLVPLLLSTGATRACLEALDAAASASGLQCERQSSGLTLCLVDLPDSSRACPLLATAFQLPTDTPRMPPVLQSTQSGWKALVPQLSPPPGVAARSSLCSGAVVTFGSQGATLCYPPPSAWSIHDLLLDLQGVAMAHALLRRLGEQRVVGELEGIRIAEASCAGIGLHTRARRHVRIEWRGSNSSDGAAPTSAAAMAIEPPPQPVLQLRLRVDGVPLPAVHRQALTLLDAGSFGELLRLCDLDAPRGAGGEGGAEAAVATPPPRVSGGESAPGACGAPGAAAAAAETTTNDQSKAQAVGSKRRRG